MNRYTDRQVKHALAQEQLLKRLKQGEKFATLCQELGLQHSRDYMPELQRRYRAGGATWEALIDHRHGHHCKVTPERRQWLRERKREDLRLTQQELAALYTAEFGQALSQARVSNILRAEGVAIPGGIQYHPPEERALPVEQAGAFFPSGRRRRNGRAADRDPGDRGPASDLSGA